MQVRVDDEKERWMVLFQNSEPLVEGRIRDAAAEHEVLEAFHNSCCNRKRGIIAVLGLMVETL